MHVEGGRHELQGVCGSLPSWTLQVQNQHIRTCSKAGLLEFLHRLEKMRLNYNAQRTAFINLHYPSSLSASPPSFFSVSICLSESGFSELEPRGMLEVRFSVNHRAGKTGILISQEQPWWWSLLYLQAQATRTRHETHIAYLELQGLWEVAAELKTRVLLLKHLLLTHVFPPRLPFYWYVTAASACWLNYVGFFFRPRGATHG